MSLYTDNTVLYCFSSNLKDIESNLNEYKITLNLGKTKSMLTASECKHINASNISVFVFDKEIKGKRNLKYLGLIISSSFTQMDHIDHASCRINKLLGLLHRIKYLLCYSKCILFCNIVIL